MVSHNGKQVPTHWPPTPKQDASLNALKMRAAQDVKNSTANLAALISFANGQSCRARSTSLLLRMTAHSVLLLLAEREQFNGPATHAVQQVDLHSLARIVMDEHDRLVGAIQGSQQEPARPTVSRMTAFLVVLGVVAICLGIVAFALTR
jgi:hypothetical protein